MTTMTSDPTNEPTNEPSYEPSYEATNEPTIEPTNEPTTAEPTEQPTKTPTDDPDEEDIHNQQFRCRYRDLLPDFVPLRSRYGIIFGNAILRTISSLQSDLWTERGCSVIDFIICTVFTIDIINDSCKTDVFDSDSSGLNENEYYAYGTFGIRMLPQYRHEYQLYISSLMSSNDFIDTFTQNMNDDLDEEANTDSESNRRLLTDNFKALSIEVIDASAATTNVDDDDSSEIIVAVILVLVGLLIVIGYIWYIKKKKGDENETRSGTNRAVEMGQGETLIAGDASGAAHTAVDDDENATLV